jgi:hypothetical protein
MRQETLMVVSLKLRLQRSKPEYFTNSDSACLGCIPFLQKYVAIGNRGYKNEVRLHGLNASLRRQALFV